MLLRCDARMARPGVCVEHGLGRRIDKHIERVFGAVSGGHKRGEIHIPSHRWLFVIRCDNVCRDPQSARAPLGALREGIEPLQRNRNRA